MTLTSYDYGLITYISHGQVISVSTSSIKCTIVTHSWIIVLGLSHPRIVVLGFLAHLGGASKPFLFVYKP